MSSLAARERETSRLNQRRGTKANGKRKFHSGEVSLLLNDESSFGEIVLCEWTAICGAPAPSGASYEMSGDGRDVDVFSKKCSEWRGG